MTVIVLENRRSPVVTLQAWVRAGSVTEAEFMGSGISHFVEHMLFKGTERRAVGQIGLEVKECGGQTNAHTSYERTVYYITFHADYFDKALDILADVLMHSTFDPAEVERERQVILKEIQMNRDAPFRHLYMMAHNTAYAVHPYRHPIIGYENLLRDLTRDDLLTYYRRLYVPNNIAFVAVGDFDASQALQKITDAFRDFDRASIAPCVIPQEPVQQGPRSRVEEFDVAVTHSMLGFHGPDVFSEDMYPMDVLAIVLGGGDTSRLYRELRENQKIAYDVSAWSATPQDPGMFWIFTTFEPENAEGVETAIWEQIEALREEGVSEEELGTARAKVLSGYLFSKESVEGEARSLGSGELDAHDISFDRRYVESITRVTPQDVHRVLGNYFRPENAVTATLMPAAGTGRDADEAAGPRETGGPPRIEKTVLPNGLTVLVREDPSTETVAIRLVTLGGARAENASNSGITNLMTKVMLKGTTTRSAEEIATAIESRGGRISSFSGHNSFGFEVDMLSRDAEIGLAVLADVVAEPAFDQREVELEKEAALASIRRIDDRIFSAAMKFFRHTMFGEHPYGFMPQGTAEVVQSLTPAQLEAFHTESAVASRMVLSIFGDIEGEHMVEVAGRSFGKLRKGDPLNSRSPDVPQWTEPRREAKPMNKEQLAIMVGFPGCSVDSPDRYPLELLASFLNSQGGKLFQTLRDERGLAYSVGAFNILGVDPGAFVLYIMTAPEKQEEAIDGLFEVVEGLRREGVEDEDLERTKVEVMGAQAISLQTNGALATEATFDELYGMGYNNYAEYDANIQAVTTEDMRRVISDVLDMESYTLVTVGNLGNEGG
jgi:zinc protease